MLYQRMGAPVGLPKSVFSPVSRS